MEKGWRVADSNKAEEVDDLILFEDRGKHAPGYRRICPTRGRPSTKDTIADFIVEINGV
jgi:hypothetical protein